MRRVYEQVCRLPTQVGACTKPTPVQVRPLWCVSEDHQMNEDEDKPEPADDQLLWIVVAFIAFMLTLMTLRSCL